MRFSPIILGFAIGCAGEPVLEQSLQQTGLPPADTGARTVFHVDDYGADTNAAYAIFAAGLAAYAVGGAVVFDRLYDVEATSYVFPGVFYTGGGVRRSCTFNSPPQAQTMFIPWISWPYPDGIVFDSVLIDGGWDPDNGCHEGYNGVTGTTVSLRGHNTVRNSVFRNTPSENLTMCGGTIENVTAYNLGGSIVHKSCTAEVAPQLDVLHRVRVFGVNLLGDAQLEHSEGAITLSASAGGIVVSDSEFSGGAESFIGDHTSEKNILVVGSRISDFPELVGTAMGVPETGEIRFVDTEIVNVGP